MGEHAGSVNGGASAGASNWGASNGLGSCLGLDHVDLFLVHAPTKPIEKREEVWKIMEGLLHDGLTRSIGVSPHAKVAP